MKPNDAHPVILKGLKAAFGLSEEQTKLAMRQVNLVTESQQFIKAAQRLPVDCMRAAVGFVDAYFGIYPEASFKDHGRNVLELSYYRYEDNVRVGVGLIVRHGQMQVFRLENLHGVETFTGNKTFRL